MDPKKPKNDLTRAYKMQMIGENDAEITMYGEVVDRRPVDFWTGEPVQGNFIAVNEFIRDLDELSTKDNITVHINSVGGDLYGGIAIYNRLKALPANIVTVNDGLAASAGSIIFQAGDVRKVNKGSNIMVHQAMGFLFGYYQSKDLKDVIKQLDAGNKAAVNIYAEASGRDPEALKAMVDKETWLTGQEAVDAGFADEVIESEIPVSMSLNADRSMMMVNGVVMTTKGMSNIPDGIPVMPKNFSVSYPAENPEDDKQKRKDERSSMMQIKNIDDLRAEFPDLLAQAEATAREEGRTAGASEERSRLQGIEAIQNAIADKTMINSAKYGENPLTAEQLAFRAMQAQASIGMQVIASMRADAETSHANEVQSAPNGGIGKEDVDPMEEIRNTVNTFKEIMNGGKNSGK